jgi:hypothetical protein
MANDVPDNRQMRACGSRGNAGGAIASDPPVPDPAPDPSAGAARGPPQSEPIDVPSPVPDNAPPPNEPTGVPPILPPEIRVIPNTTAKSQHHWNLIRIGDPSRCRRGPPRR